MYAHCCSAVTQSLRRTCINPLLSSARLSLGSFHNIYVNVTWWRKNRKIEKWSKREANCVPSTGQWFPPTFFPCGEMERRPLYETNPPRLTNRVTNAFQAIPATSPQRNATIPPFFFFSLFSILYSLLFSCWLSFYIYLLWLLLWLLLFPISNSSNSRERKRKRRDNGDKKRETSSVAVVRVREYSTVLYTSSRLSEWEVVPLLLLLLLLLLW